MVCIYNNVYISMYAIMHMPFSQQLQCIGIYYVDPVAHPVKVSNATAYVCIYCMHGTFGDDFNLAVWRI